MTQFIAGELLGIVGNSAPVRLVFEKFRPRDAKPKHGTDRRRELHRHGTCGPRPPPALARKGRLWPSPSSAVVGWSSTRK
jgi:hypothetical protein